MTAERELKSCPFCGGRDIIVPAQRATFARCLTCEAEGPYAKTQTDGAATWNRRFASDDRDSVIEECAKVAEALGERFDAGSQKFISSETDKYNSMQERSGGCFQSAKAIRALKHSLET